MGTLLVTGAINTDLIAFVERAPEAGETVAGGYFEQHGGGKAANQAVAAARSGASVALLGAVGQDKFGENRLKELQDDGIDTTGVIVVEGSASGVAIIIVESSGENRISDLPGAREHLTAEQCLAAINAAEPAALLVANELSHSCLQTLFNAANERGIPVWFNVAPYSYEARALVPLVDTLIVNRGEAEDILGIRGAGRGIAELAASLTELGAANVIVTLGAEGVVGYHGEREFLIPAEKVTPVDTTGAGDTFCGAWAAEVLRGASFEDALAYGNRAAAISVTRRGAQTSIPSRSEIVDS